MSLLAGDEFKYNKTVIDSNQQKLAEGNIEGAEILAEEDKVPEQLEEGTQQDLEDNKDEWSPEEIDSLVEGISECQNDWDKIAAEFMKSRFTAAQCVFKFLELPLTENMLAKIGIG